MRKTFFALALFTLAGPLVAQTTPQVTNDLTFDMAPRAYRICNERPERPIWMDEINPRESYQALTLMDLYELRAWERIVESGDCSCEARFPDWASAEAEFDENYTELQMSEHTAAQRDIRRQRNGLRHAVQDICVAQGNW